MKNFRLLLIASVFVGLAQTGLAQNQLVVYPAPQGAELKDDFTVKVREAGGEEWQTIDTYAVKVDEVRGPKHHVELASLAYFDFNGEVEVSVTSRRGKIETGQVRPLSYQIVPQLNDSTLTFRLDRPRNLSVEVNGDIFHNLHLFAGPIDENNPLKPGMSPKKLKKNRNLIYFGPGIHQLPGDTLDVPSGKTVYVAGGAVVKGCIRAHGVENVHILGRGKVHPEGRGAGISIKQSKHVTVEGLITTQCPTGGSDSIVIRNVKCISSYNWGDGLNVFASNNVLFDGVFCRTSDDCTTVYGTRFEFTGGCRNITMQNSTLWADVAHPIFIGIHGNVENPEILENLNYINIDILDHKEMQVDYQGCLAINAGDENLVRNVRFENIRIENFRQGQLLNLRIFFNEKYCKAPGRGIENVLFKDISYTGDRASASIIEGYNEQRRVKNIRFENLRINGQLISDDMPDKPKWYKTSDMMGMYVGPHTEGIKFVSF
ncbi:MAG: glycosyl hydrolase family 28 protein [Bacteroides sp.]|nr:glycosyl hydrolase family 28 protein [Bacteroides sp.]